MSPVCSATTTDPPRHPRSYDVVREHVEHLLAAVPETSPRVFAAAAGISLRTMSSVLRGDPDARVSPEVCRRITSIEAEDLHTDLSRNVPGDDTRDRVQNLISKGFTMSDIADRAGVAVSSLRPRNLASIRLSTAVAVTRAHEQLTKDTDPTLVPACGITRRIQALRVLGWPLAELSARSGLSVMSLCGGAGHVVVKFHTRETHDRANALYQGMKFKPGPSAKAVKAAKATGCAPWAAWDHESDMDMPDKHPDFHFVEDPEWARNIRRRYQPNS